MVNDSICLIFFCFKFFVLQIDVSFSLFGEFCVFDEEYKCIGISGEKNVLFWCLIPTICILLHSASVESFWCVFMAHKWVEGYGLWLVDKKKTTETLRKWHKRPFQLFIYSFSFEYSRRYNWFSNFFIWHAP